MTSGCASVVCQYNAVSCMILNAGWGLVSLGAMVFINLGEAA
jgi:hypothetical protein